MGSGESVDLIDKVVSMRSIYPQCEVHLGCDSQNIGKHTVYVIAVVFRFPSNGAHVIYTKEKVPAVRDLWTKLWGETDRAVQLAEFLRLKVGVRVKQIDLDYNEDPGYPSHKILGAAEGYVKSLGYIPKAKPHLLMAAWAADVLCH